MNTFSPSPFKVFTYRGYRTASFINRLNRFISEVEIDGEIEKVYVPNTGRLSELAIPGNTVLLEEYEGRYRYKMKYIIHRDFPVMINSSYSNRLFEEILKNSKLSPFSEYSFMRSEPTHGSHRFDFLVEKNDEKKYIELKSCTLGYKNVASFPDAISERASKHIVTLSDIENSTIIFLILLDKIDIFIPNYHTDFAFYENLKKYRYKIDIRAYSVRYDRNLSIKSLKEVPVLIPEVKPSGIYTIVLHNSKDQAIDVGALGKIYFPKGYYVYCGSARNSLFKRIAHHRKKNRKFHWHMDYIKHHMKIIADTPIVTESVSECELASSINNFADSQIDKFGSTDCKCRSHLYFFENNPVQTDIFWETILNFRFNKYT